MAAAPPHQQSAALSSVPPSPQVPIDCVRGRAYEIPLFCSGPLTGASRGAARDFVELSRNGRRLGLSHVARRLSAPRREGGSTRHSRR